MKCIWSVATVHQHPALDLNDVITVLMKFTSWDRAQAQRAGRRDVGRPRRVGTDDVQGDSIRRRRAPHPGFFADRSSFKSRATLPPVAHEARRNPPTFYPGPTMGDFPPKVRGQLPGFLEGLVSVRCRR